MARYNVRDVLGHWVRPRSQREHMCRHACCRGHRVHPSNMPVILPNRLLRRASEDDLAEHYNKTDSDEARAQVLHEMDRRDQRNARRKEALTRRRALMFGRKMEHQEEVERSIVEAEAATNGYMLNRRGRALGISERSLFTGREATARRYASEELLEHWRTHHRPTAAMMRGEDTRVHESYTASSHASGTSRRPPYARPRSVATGGATASRP